MNPSKGNGYVVYVVMNVEEGIYCYKEGVVVSVVGRYPGLFGGWRWGNAYRLELLLDWYRN